MWKPGLFLNSYDSQYFYTIGALIPLDKYSQKHRKTLPYSKYGMLDVSKIMVLLPGLKKNKNYKY